jgi:hypothetical protein
MSRRRRHGRNRAHLREVTEEFERDWRDDRDAADAEEIAVNEGSDSYAAMQAQVENLRTELQTAKAQIVTMGEACQARWTTSSFIVWLFTTAAIFGTIGYIARVLTE